MIQRHCLTEDQWDLISDLVEVQPKRTGRRPKDRRTILNGIFWILRTGAAWRDLPERFGKWQTVYDHFNNCSKDGTFDAILQRLQSASVAAEEIDEGLWCVDGTIVRAARCAAGARKKGRRIQCKLASFGALSRRFCNENPLFVRWQRPAVNGRSFACPGPRVEIPPRSVRLDRTF